MLHDQDAMFLQRFESPDWVICHHFSHLINSLNIGQGWEVVDIWQSMTFVIRKRKTILTVVHFLCDSLWTLSLWNHWPLTVRWDLNPQKMFNLHLTWPLSYYQCSVAVWSSLRLTVLGLNPVSSMFIITRVGIEPTKNVQFTFNMTTKLLSVVCSCMVIA